MTPSARPQYQAYLLRCWEECAGPNGTRMWRFSLEHARTGQRRGFTSLSELAAALENELASDRPAGPDRKGETDMR